MEHRSTGQESYEREAYPPCYRGHGIHCIVPPHMVEAILLRGNNKQRKMAEQVQREAASFRTMRQDPELTAAIPMLATFESTAELQPQRKVYDGGGRVALPGKLLREEGGEPTGDAEADQAYDGAGHCYRLYADIFARDSLDGRGLVIESTVHHRRKYNNAFWNGKQMAYGDGDGMLFKALTGDLAVIGHELSHGVVQYSGGLIYEDESGALNEHFADVFGVLTVQYQKGQEATEADWLVGAEILGDGIHGSALRSMKAPGTAYDDEVLGTDPQPFHMDAFVNTPADNGGVHINSGIPNQAFYLLAVMLGGKAWEKAGHVWYDTLQAIRNPRARFIDWAEKTFEQASQRFGVGSLEAKLTRRAWKMVGLNV